jgi:hypothetical protein
MPIFFVEIPVASLHSTPSSPDTDTDYIYEHLKYYCSKFFPLPAIDVSLVAEKLVVTGRHKYLRIAQDLGYPWVRAAYRSRAFDPQEVLRELPVGVRITPRELLERESAMTVFRDHHIYFFDKPLGPQGQIRFLEDIAGFFERLETPLIDTSEKRLFGWDFPFGGRCAEFEALIPVGDHTCMSSYRGICQRFSFEVQRIVSFQGHLFFI